jgi:MGT family glycosyltransferase
MSEDAKIANPKRFLFCSGSGSGHFHPLVPLAQALQAAGHAVAFAASPSLQTAVEQLGLRFFPVITNRKTDPEYQQLKPILDQLPLSLESEMFIYSKVFCGVATRLTLPGLLEIAQSWKPDMFIRDSTEYASVLAAELLGLPQIEINPLASLKSLFTFEQGAPKSLEPLRQSWGLAPDPQLKSVHSKLLLTFAPPGFSLPGSGAVYPADIQFIRPHFFDQSGNETLPAWVADLPAQPIIYVTLGTQANTLPGMLETIINGLRDEPFNLIVTVGRDKNPADFGEQPPNVHIEQYIPQSLLLPHCDLMVQHGGSNSLLQALDVGLPFVIVPLIADQFFNADIVKELELGTVVELDRLNPANIKAAVHQTLANPLYRQNIARVQTEMQTLPDLDHALNLIYQVLNA